jgi:hypothetical protein
MTTLQYIVDGARVKANDPTGIRITNTKAVRWGNDAQLAIVTTLPIAGFTRTLVTPGATCRQTLLALGLTDAIQLLDLGCNVAADGVTIGNQITKRKRAEIADFNPAWQNMPGTAADHYVYDERDPTTFYLFPQITSGGGKIEIEYAKKPTLLTAVGDNLTVGDAYQQAMETFILASHYGTVNGVDFNPQLAQTYMQMFYKLLGVRTQNIAQNSGSADAKARTTPTPAG